MHQLRVSVCSNLLGDTICCSAAIGAVSVAAVCVYMPILSACIGPSLAAQASLLPPERQLAASVVEVADSSSAQVDGEQLLLSSGNGDITYCLQGTASEPVFPMQQSGGPQAFILAGAAAFAGDK